MTANVSLRNQRSILVVAEGVGLFPLGALVRADGFFASVEASRAARNTMQSARRVAVVVPDPERLAELLRAEGWRAEWEEFWTIPSIWKGL